jgi:hypothetical protein
MITVVAGGEVRPPPQPTIPVPSTRSAGELSLETSSSDEPGRRGERPRQQDHARPVSRHEPPAHRRGRTEPDAERGKLGARGERRVVLDALHVRGSRNSIPSVAM